MVLFHMKMTVWKMLWNGHAGIWTNFFFCILSCHNIFFSKTHEVNQRHSEGWMGRTAIDWAEFGDCNVCIVDWSRLAFYDYPVAAGEHTKMVSRAISNLINFLEQHGMNIEEVSIAGHR